MNPARPTSYSRARPRGDRDARAPATAASISTPPSAPAATAAPFSILAGTRVVGIDRDRTAISGGFDLVDRSAGRLTLVEDRFSNLAEVCAAQGLDAVDGVVMDVGVSSMQLDQADRGFSFRLGGPLDMRMGHDGPTAADVVAKASEADLANIIYIFGEERYSRGVAKAIVAARKEAPIDDHQGAGRHRLQGGVAEAGRNPSRHPHVSGVADLRQRGARRTASGAVGGRAHAEAGRPAGGGVVPLAGRPHRQEFPRSSAARPAAARGICRRSTQAAPSFAILTKRPVTAGDDEVAANPRARSAKLRAAERTEAPRARRRGVAGMAAFSTT